ncbi:hypothetical protein K474DRAFT_1664914 [Panus rudis PR-1116 ss-1]|nr:hypothetical protein K474DRAFT_1664914 [Panus rudis PR-1116 ss-1]
MMRFTDLPQELADMIIDQLHGDTRSLKAASLVSRFFLPRSQENLFELLTFSVAGASDANVTMKLREFLQQNKHLACLVKTFCLQGAMSCRGRLQRYEWATIDLVSLAEVTALFPNLQCLDLGFVNVQSRNGPFEHMSELEDNQSWQPVRKPLRKLCMNDVLFVGEDALGIRTMLSVLDQYSPMYELECKRGLKWLLSFPTYNPYTRLNGRIESDKIPPAIRISHLTVATHTYLGVGILECMRRSKHADEVQSVNLVYHGKEQLSMARIALEALAYCHDFWANGHVFVGFGSPVQHPHGNGLTRLGIKDVPHQVQ